MREIERARSDLGLTAGCDPCVMVVGVGRWSRMPVETVKLALRPLGGLGGDVDVGDVAVGWRSRSRPSFVDGLGIIRPAWVVGALWACAESLLGALSKL